MLAGPAQHDAAHRRVSARSLDRVGDRGHRREVPGVAARLAVPADHSGDEPGGPPRSSCPQAGCRRLPPRAAVSPRAVRWTMRVLCSATGSEPGSSRATSKRARARPAAARPAAVGARSRRAPPRRARAAGASGRPRPPRSGVRAGLAGEQRADRLRVDVHGLHAQHVVAAAVDPDPRRAAPARARRGPHARQVARAVAQQRRGLAAQVRPHELAARAVLELERLAAVRVDQLEHGVLRHGEVEALALAAGAHRGPDVAHPERVGHERPTSPRSRRARRRPRRPARPR